VVPRRVLTGARCMWRRIHDLAPVSPAGGVPLRYPVDTVHDPRSRYAARPCPLYVTPLLGSFVSSRTRQHTTHTTHTAHTSYTAHTAQYCLDHLTAMGPGGCADNIVLTLYHLIENTDMCFYVSKKVLSSPSRSRSRLCG
jgi:hypothetical protein